MSEKESELIPLSDAAKSIGVNPEHLSLLVRQGKLGAQKVGQRWFTTKKWIDEYFHPGPTPKSGQAFFEARQVLDVLDLVSGELRELKKQMSLEQGQKEALLFAFESLQVQVREDIDRRVAELYYELQNQLPDQNQLSGVNADAENDSENKDADSQVEVLEEEKRQMAEFFVRQLNILKKQLDEEMSLRQELKVELLAFQEKLESATRRDEENLEAGTAAADLDLSEIPKLGEEEVWQRAALGGSEVHVLAQRLQPTVNLRTTKFHYFSFVLGVLLLVASFGILRSGQELSTLVLTNGSRYSQTVLIGAEQTLARFGTEELLVTRVGNDLGREVAYVVAAAGRTSFETLTHALRSYYVSMSRIFHLEKVAGRSWNPPPLQ